MLKSLKRHWRELKRSEPGKRFREQYERGANKESYPMKKPLLMAAGILLVLTGLFLMVVPGPGIPILLMGAVLIAGQSLAVARFLDWLEVKLRPMVSKVLGKLFPRHHRA